MKLSTKGRYGLRAMIDIALNQGQGPVTIANIAERQEISDRYLEQLLTALKQNGLITSIRGFQGGYLLAKASDSITVGDIIKALEGPIAPVDCTNEAKHTTCPRVEHCVTQKVWEDLKQAMVRVLDSYTLESLVEESRKMGTGSFDHYCI